MAPQKRLKTTEICQISLELAFFFIGFARNQKKTALAFPSEPLGSQSISTSTLYGTREERKTCGKIVENCGKLWKISRRKWPPRGVSKQQMVWSRSRWLHTCFPSSCQLAAVCAVAGEPGVPVFPKHPHFSLCNTPQRRGNLVQIPERCTFSIHPHSVCRPSPCCISPL